LGVFFGSFFFGPREGATFAEVRDNFETWESIFLAAAAVTAVLNLSALILGAAARLSERDESDKYRSWASYSMILALLGLVGSWVLVGGAFSMGMYGP